jgi:hypothetical protein
MKDAHDTIDILSVSGAMHRGWINIKSLVTGKDEAAIVAEAERGEDAAVAACEQALGGSLPPRRPRHRRTPVQDREGGPRSRARSGEGDEPVSRREPERGHPR